MSCYFKHQQETTITIPSNVDISGTSNGFFCFYPICNHKIPMQKSKSIKSIEKLIPFAGTTYYNIHVSIGSVNWTVRHRYKEFVELHTKLVNGQSIGRDLLPPKKVKYADTNSNSH